MTTLTFLGLTGGAGTTTLVALTLLSHRGSEHTLPELTSYDPHTLEQRIGHAFPSVTGVRRIVDAGRSSPHKLHRALSAGHTVLVAPPGPRGEHAIATATSGLDLPGYRILGPHVSIVRVAVNGPVRDPAQASGLFCLPYDRLLAHGTPLSTTMPRLTRRTHLAIDRWAQLLEDQLWRTRPVHPQALAQLPPARPAAGPAPEHQNPWTQQSAEPV